MKTIVGIDWSEKKHCVHIHNERGAELARMEIEQSIEGFQRLAAKLSQVNSRPGDCLMAIETEHNLLVDFLHRQGYTIYILAPILVYSNRSRQGSSGAKDDDRDARLLADILRTDRGALIQWQPDGALVQQMRSLLSWVDDLTKQIVQEHNRLRANLLRYYPQPLLAFNDLLSLYVLRFLANYPAPTDLAGLTLAQFSRLCHEYGYTRADKYPIIWAALQKPSPDPDEDVIPAFRSLTVWLAEQLLKLKRQKEKTLAQVQSLFWQHPDAPIFDSLPGTGKMLAPKLLVMFGDHRQRYPVRELLPTIAGTVPVTIASGNSRFVKFRRACNRDYRRTTQHFARSSIRKSEWAASYFAQLIQRGKSKSHAYRCLANRWLHIIWSIWQKRELYDEAYHLQQVSRHRRPLLT
jgi:transposase